MDGSGTGDSILQLTASSAATAHCMSMIKDGFEASNFEKMGKYPIRICAGTRLHVQNELERFPPKIVLWCGAGEGCSPQKITSGGTQPEALDLESLLVLLEERKHAKPYKDRVYHA